MTCGCRRAFALAVLAGLLATIGMVVPAGMAPAAEPAFLARSDTPQTIAGEGDAAFTLETPATVTWRSAGNRFSLEAKAEGAEKPAAVSATQGQGQGRIGLRGDGRHHLTITAEGPWNLQVTW